MGNNGQQRLIIVDQSRVYVPLLSTARKGRPEQGILVTTSRYGPVKGDTGCVSGGTDQRVAGCLFNGPADMPGACGLGYSQE